MSLVMGMSVGLPPKTIKIKVWAEPCVPDVIVGSGTRIRGDQTQ